jgi:hypothetical protein
MKLTIQVTLEAWMKRHPANAKDDSSGLAVDEIT